MLSSLLAVTTGFGLGVLAQEQLLAILIAFAIPSLIWLTRAIGAKLPASNQLDSVNLPSSIFKSEYEDVDFIDDRERMQKKKIWSTTISYVAGIGVGSLMTPLLTMI